MIFLFKWTKRGLLVVGAYTVFYLVREFLTEDQ